MHTGVCVCVRGSLARSRYGKNDTHTMNTARRGRMRHRRHATYARGVRKRLHAECAKEHCGRPQSAHRRGHAQHGLACPALSCGGGLDLLTQRRPRPAAIRCRSRVTLLSAHTGGQTGAQPQPALLPLFRLSSEGERERERARSPSSRGKDLQSLEYGQGPLFE